MPEQPKDLQKREETKDALQPSESEQAIPKHISEDARTVASMLASIGFIVGVGGWLIGVSPMLLIPFILLMCFLGFLTVHHYRIKPKYKKLGEFELENKSLKAEIALLKNPEHQIESYKQDISEQGLKLKAPVIDVIGFRVFDGETKVGLFGATCIARNDETNKEYRGDTDKYGIAKFRVPHGLYTVTIKAENYKTHVEAAIASDDEDEGSAHVYLQRRAGIASVNQEKRQYKIDRLKELISEGDEYYTQQWVPITHRTESYRPRVERFLEQYFDESYIQRFRENGLTALQEFLKELLD
jgi:F0F1-type ATP synthase assembly protein I